MFAFSLIIKTVASDRFLVLINEESTSFVVFRKKEAQFFLQEGFKYNDFLRKMEVSFGKTMTKKHDEKSTREGIRGKVMIKPHHVVLLGYEHADVSNVKIYFLREDRKFDILEIKMFFERDDDILLSLMNITNCLGCLFSKVITTNQTFAFDFLTKKPYFKTCVETSLPNMCFSIIFERCKEPFVTEIQKTDMGYEIQRDICQNKQCKRRLRRTKTAIKRQTVCVVLVDSNKKFYVFYTDCSTEKSEFYKRKPVRKFYKFMKISSEILISKLVQAGENV